MPCELRWIDNLCGIAAPSQEVEGEPCKGDLYLLLAHQPDPAPAPMWTPPAEFGDGEYLSLEMSLRLADQVHQIYHEHLSILCPGYTKPAPGRWRVEFGRATHLGPNEEPPQ